MSKQYVCAAVTGLLAAMFVTGCSLQTAEAPVTSQGVIQLSGHAMGGSQPIASSTIQLYAVGTAGDGSAAASQLTSVVTSGSDGSFNITSQYSCPSTTSLMYITATGGNPGTGGNNSAISLMAALGQCQTLKPSTTITINELTTVAAVYALAPYMNSATTIGSSYIDSVALSSGFMLASQYANFSTGSSPGLNVPSNKTVPTTQLNTIANAIAACVNTSSGTSSNCNTLMSATTIGGVTPTDVLGATLNLALNATSISTANTNAIYGLVSANPPYQPTDSSAPANWTAPLTTVVSSPLLATGDSRTVTQPVTPTSVCTTLTAQFTPAAVDVATPPTSDDTARINSAINSCAATGQAIVLAAGTGSNTAFLAGPLTLKGGESLVINSGVTLYANQTVYSASQFILANATPIGIYGPGAIDGRANVTASSTTPRLVQTTNSSGFIIYNVTLQNAAKPNLYIQGGNGATVWGVTILTSPSQSNADGIDVDSITNVTVKNSLITAGDDGVAVKSNNSNTSNVTVENNRLFGTHGLSIGSIVSNTVTNVLFQNNYVYGASQVSSPFGAIVSGNANAINVKVDPCTLTVTQVTFQNTCITQAKHLIEIETNYSSCGTGGSPTINDVVVNGVSATSSISGAYTNLYGYSAADPIVAYFANMSLDNNSMYTTNPPQYGTYYLNNVNGWTPTGTGITNSTFTINGSVPSCAF